MHPGYSSIGSQSCLILINSERFHKDNVVTFLQREATGSHSTADDQDGFHHENFNSEEFNCEIDASRRHIYTGTLINGNAAKVGENNAVFEDVIDNPSMVQVVRFQHVLSRMPANQLEDIAQDYTDNSSPPPRHQMQYELVKKQIKDGALGKNRNDKTEDCKSHVTQHLQHRIIPEGAGGTNNYCEDATKEPACQNTDQHKHQKHYKAIFKCEICHLKFHIEDELREHKASVHFNQMSFECGLCGEKFKQSNEIQEHSCVHKGKNKQQKLHVIHELPNGVPLVSAIIPGSALDAGKQSVFIKCQFCGATFDQVLNLQHHMQMHELEKTFKCDVCGKSFESRSTLSVHSFVHSGKDKYYCDTCYKVFRVKGTFIRHKSRCNQNGDDNHKTGLDGTMLKQACTALGIVNKKEKPDRSDNAEPKLEERQFDTSEGRDVPSESLVINEKNQVSQSQPLQANGANNPDQNDCQSDLSETLKSSISQTRNKVKDGSEVYDEMAFECKLCGLRFEEQKSFLEHSSNHFQDMKQNGLKSSETSPINSQLILIRCNLCGEIFDEHAKLDQHMPSHGVQLSYPCRECGKMFSSKGLLLHHTRVHSDARNYACDLCQRTFKYKGSLKKHQKHCIKDPNEQENFDRWFTEKLKATSKFNIAKVVNTTENCES